MQWHWSNNKLVERKNLIKLISYKKEPLAPFVFLVTILLSQENYMLLSGRMLANVADVNTWEFTDSLAFTQGDTVVVNFQLIDANKDRLLQGFKPSGKRHIPATGATLQVTIQNIDSTKTITKTATKSFIGDDSVWKFTLVPGDALTAGTYSIRLALNEATVITSGSIKAALSVVSTTAAYI